MLQFGASLTYDTSSINYDRNMFIIQATGLHGISKAISECLWMAQSIIHLKMREQMVATLPPLGGERGPGENAKENGGRATAKEYDGGGARQARGQDQQSGSTEWDATCLTAERRNTKQRADKTSGLSSSQLLVIYCCLIHIWGSFPGLRQVNSKQPNASGQVEELDSMTSDDNAEDVDQADSTPGKQ